MTMEKQQNMKLLTSKTTCVEALPDEAKDSALSEFPFGRMLVLPDKAPPFAASWFPLFGAN